MAHDLDKDWDLAVGLSTCMIFFEVMHAKVMRARFFLGVNVGF